MLFQALSLRCQCGRPPMRIREVGLTGNHELAVYWQCAACRRPVFAVKPLSECWAECPKEEETATPPLLPPPADQSLVDQSLIEQSLLDREFLRSLGVQPDQPEGESA